MEITPLEKWIAGRLADTTRQIAIEQIESYKVQKLRETIQWARTRSPIYKQRFAGLTEKELVHPRDLGRFPFTTADELRQNPMRFLCVSQSEVERVVTLQTSATTGDPKRIYFTEEDQLATIDFFRVGMSTLPARESGCSSFCPENVPAAWAICSPGHWTAREQWELLMAPSAMPPRPSRSWNANALMLLWESQSMFSRLQGSAMEKPRLEACF